MDTIFSELTAAENTQLLDGIPLITILIGTADGELDDHESQWAERVVKFRSFTNNEDLSAYYKAISATFDERLNHFIRVMPEEKKERRSFYSEHLANLNPILAKLNGIDAYRLYNDFLSFAKHVAKASGGILYMGNVSPEEKELINLDMLTPIDAGI